MWKLLKYFLCTVLAIIVCLWGIALWQIDRNEERTINIVEQEPQRFPIVCELHGMLLEWDRVPVYYGLMLYDINDKELFPYSNKWVGGGCLGGGEPRYGFIRYCQRCREAESTNPPGPATQE
jgi:hypothetical protein